MSALVRHAAAAVADECYLRRGRKARARVADATSQGRFLTRRGRAEGAYYWLVETDVVVPVSGASDKTEIAACTLRAKITRSLPSRQRGAISRHCRPSRCTRPGDRQPWVQAGLPSSRLSLAAAAVAAAARPPRASWRRRGSRKSSRATRRQRRRRVAATASRRATQSGRRRWRAALTPRSPQTRRAARRGVALRWLAAEPAAVLALVAGGGAAAARATHSAPLQSAVC